MTELVQRVAASIRDRQLLKRGQPALVAVSGGVDSMVLLEVMRGLADVNGWRLTVAHFNHRLRGRSSDADERLVKRVARSLRLPCVVGRGDIRRKAKTDGVSIEMAAREARHGFLAEAALERGIKTIALAHHADDQLELFFLRLLRGAGSRGLGGMNWSNKSPVDKRVTLIRPLLDCRKEELAESARVAHVRFREDESNESVEFLRNRLRHELLPLLKRHYQPAIDRVVARQMEILSAESELLEKLGEDWRRARSPHFREIAVALQRRVLQQELLALGGGAVEFDALEKLRVAPNRPVSLTDELTVIHDGEGKVRRVESAPRSFANGSLEVDFEGNLGQGSFAGLDWRWESRDARAGRPRFSAGAEWFDAEKVGPTAVLRHWQPGDRFQPSGMARLVKLQDLFTNLKIPAEQRRGLVVAANAAGEIWWVEGVRIAERFKLSPKTRRRLWWQWQRKD